MITIFQIWRVCRTSGNDVNATSVAVESGPGSHNMYMGEAAVNVSKRKGNGGRQQDRRNPGGHGTSEESGGGGWD